MAVYIEQQSETRFRFHYRVLIEKAVNAVMEHYHIPEDLDVNVMIVSPEAIRQINKDNRGIDQVTDVLSFPYYEYDTPGVFDAEEEPLEDPANADSANAESSMDGPVEAGAEEEPCCEEILGDIVICAEKVISQAKEYGHSEKRELAFLTVHSMLHLIGYDHMQEEDAKIMESEQDIMMSILGILR